MCLYLVVVCLHLPGRYCNKSAAGDVGASLDCQGQLRRGDMFSTAPVLKTATDVSILPPPPPPVIFHPRPLLGDRFRASSSSLSLSLSLSPPEFLSPKLSHTYTNMYMHAYAYICTHIHTHTHTHARTHTHVYVRAFSLILAECRFWMDIL